MHTLTSAALVLWTASLGLDGGAVSRADDVVQATAAARVCRAQRGDAAALPANAAKGTIADAAWIAGVWTGAAGPAAVEEHWTPAADGVMLGIGRTLRGERMASFEFVCITERNGTLVYSALPNARTPATDFVATAIGPGGITFENPAHDFPKLVRYARKPDGRLETTVSAGGADKGETFVLQRR